MASTPVQNIRRSLDKSEVKLLTRRGATLNAARTVMTVSAAKLTKHVGKYRSKLIDRGRGQRA